MPKIKHPPKLKKEEEARLGLYVSVFMATREVARDWQKQQAASFAVTQKKTVPAPQMKEEPVAAAQPPAARENSVVNAKLREERKNIAVKKPRPLSLRNPGSGLRDAADRAGEEVLSSSAGQEQVTEERKADAQESGPQKQELSARHLAMLKARRKAVEKGDKNIAGSIIERIIGEDAIWSDEAKELNVAEGTFSNIIHQRIGISAEVLGMMKDLWPRIFAKKHGERWEANKDEYYTIVADTHPVKSGMPAEFGDKNTVGPIMLRILNDSSVGMAEAASDLGISVSRCYQIMHGNIEISGRMAPLILNSFPSVFMGEKYRKGWELHQEEFFREVEKLPEYKLLTAKNAALESRQAAEAWNEADTEHTTKRSEWIKTPDEENKVLKKKKSWAEEASEFVKGTLDKHGYLNKEKDGVNSAFMVLATGRRPALTLENWGKLVSGTALLSLYKNAFAEIEELIPHAMASGAAERIMRQYNNAINAGHSAKRPASAEDDGVTSYAYHGNFSLS